MNQEIKDILWSHGFGTTHYSESVLKSFNDAIIKICELQKEGCASLFDEDSIDEERILKTKNIAE